MSDRRSAIICSHVLEGGLPILRAKRDALIEEEPADSGWQFPCDSGVLEGTATGRVVSIEEVVRRDPSLAYLIDREIGTVWVRLSPSDAWVKETIA
jgi:hypothetical protein